MNVKLSFNDPEVLKGYLGQVLQQTMPDNVKNIQNRVIIGAEGGLAYPLFTLDFWEIARDNPRLSTLDTIAEFRNFLKAIDTYVDQARQITNAHGTNTFVEIEDEIVLSAGAICSTSLPDLAIGNPKIGSIEELVSFVGMVKEAKPRLDSQYEALLSTARDVY